MSSHNHKFTRRWRTFRPKGPSLHELMAMQQALAAQQGGGIPGLGAIGNALLPQLKGLEEGGMELREVPDFDPLAFLDDFRLCDAWMAQYDLLGDLKKGKGIVKYKEFLPAMVADQTLDLLKKIPAGKWNLTEANKDYARNNIDHKFLSLKHSEGLERVIRCLTLLLPEELHTFSAAKYAEGHKIEPHDDKAYTSVKMDDGKLVLCSRDVACIYYLTEDWKRSDGGLLVDHVTGKEYVPEFNSLIAFKVPRMHEVTPVTNPDKPRYSLFGWFLKEGKLYDLDTEAKGGNLRNQTGGLSDRDAVKAGGQKGALGVKGKELKKKKKKGKK